MCTVHFSKLRVYNFSNNKHHKINNSKVLTQPCFCEDFRTVRCLVHTVGKIFIQITFSRLVSSDRDRLCRALLFRPILGTMYGKIFKSHSSSMCKLSINDNNSKFWLSSEIWCVYRNKSKSPSL